MEAEVTKNVQKKSGKKMPKRAIIGSVFILLIGAAFLVYFLKFNVAAKTSIQQNTAAVTKGNLSVTITGSGAIASANRKEITPVLESDSKITKVYFNQGDKVKAGDLMFELDDSTAADKVQTVESSITQQQLSQSTNASDLNKLIIYAPFSGYATSVTIKEGDTLTKGQTILTLVDKKKLKVTLPFYALTNINVGQTAKIVLEGSFQNLNGRVSYVSDKSYISADGTLLRNVDIEIDDPGYTLEGLSASAYINGIQSDSIAKFVFATTKEVKTDVAGKVKKLYVTSDQYVTGGKTLIELQSDDLVNSVQTNDLKMQDLEIQLNSAKQKLSNYKIYSPIDGTIVSQSIKVGDVVKSAQVLSTVSDNGHMEFDIPVDELDIAKVQLGQKVNVTVDALSDTTTSPLTGKVTDIALEGTSSSGVTNYPVTITMDDPTRLKGGMNANAEIIVNSKTNALYVPLEAVQKVDGKSYVWLKNSDNTTSGSQNKSNTTSSSGAKEQTSNNGSTNGSTSSGSSSKVNTQASSASQQYYANAVRTLVTVGISTTTNIEIVSGLREGDVVILPQVTATSSSSTTKSSTKTSSSSSGGMGGMDGGPGGPPPN